MTETKVRITNYELLQLGTQHSALACLLKAKGLPMKGVIAPVMMDGYEYERCEEFDSGDVIFRARRL